MMLFVGHSLRTMTASAVASVPLDWQGPVDATRAAQRAPPASGRQPGVLDAVAGRNGAIRGVDHADAGVGTIRSGAGSILAVPPDYLDHIQTFRFLRGSLRPGEVVLDQQLAATLQAQPGDLVTLDAAPRPRPPCVCASAGSRSSPPPTCCSSRSTRCSARHPHSRRPTSRSCRSPRSRASRARAADDHAGGRRRRRFPARRPGRNGRCRRRSIPALSPAARPTRCAGDAAPQPGRALSARQVASSTTSATHSTTAAGDALYAETLYIMLAVPGALVALGLAYLAALGRSSATAATSRCCAPAARRRRDLVFLAAVESLLLGLLAGVLGTGVALARRPSRWSAGRRLGSDSALVDAAASASPSRRVGAAAARLGAASPPSAAASARPAAASVRERTPLWQRLYLDLSRSPSRARLLADGAHRLLGRRQSRLEPDPLALGLHVPRACAALARRGAAARAAARPAARLARRAASPADGRRRLPGFLLASAGRRGAAINRGLLVLGLLLAFGVNLGIFAATYDQQARVDAQLTLGADVVATAPPGVVAQQAARAAHRAPSRRAGVSRGRPRLRLRRPRPPGHLRHRPGDARPRRRRCATPTSSAAAPRRCSTRLRARRDGILVSKETITDYSLQPRRPAAAARARPRDRPLPRRAVPRRRDRPGVPVRAARTRSWSRTSRYLQRVTHDPGPNVVFVKRERRRVPALARRVAAATGRDGDTRQGHPPADRADGQLDHDRRPERDQPDRGGVRARARGRRDGASSSPSASPSDATSSRRWPPRRLATRDRRVPLERGRDRARRRRSRSRRCLGWLLAEMLVAMLQHVFDPPPDHSPIPWALPRGLAGAAVARRL